MIVGSSKLVCEGIVGDGCGGGRVFVIEDEKLSAYDPQSSDRILLLEGVKNAKEISKSGCLITIKCSDETIKFDLSSLTVL
jgi:hypothetical protein